MYVFSINHFGHTQIDFLVNWEIGLNLAMQASKQVSLYSRWKRDGSGRTGLSHIDDIYTDIYAEGSIILKPLNLDNETDNEK